MDNPTPSASRLLVLGDINHDIVIAPVDSVDDFGKNWSREPQYREFRRAGGAWLLREIIRELVDKDTSVDSYPGGEDPNDVLPGHPTSIALLSRFPRTHTSDKGDEVYRLASGRSAGWIRPDPKAARAWDAVHVQNLKNLLATIPESPNPELIVIHDHNNGYRDLPVSESLVRFTQNNPHFNGSGETPPHGMIVWHTDSPLALHDLADCLCGELADHVIAVVNEDDLRNEGMDFKDDLSIEQTAEEVLGLIGRSPVRDLARCAYLVVRFSNGVMLHSRAVPAGRKEEAFVISYLPNGKRATALRGDKRGLMVGYTLLLVSAITRGVAWSQKVLANHPADWWELLDRGVRAGAELGCCYAQTHYRNGFMARGFEAVDPDPRPYTTLVRNWENNSDQKPAAEYLVASMTFAPIELAERGSKWSRIEAFGKADELERHAMDVVKRGYKEAVHHDIGRPEQEASRPQWSPRWRLLSSYFEVGDLLLIDRKEIDDFESIYALVSNYLRTPGWKQPLSIAVFGPPGSGKSFAVKQVIKMAGESNSKALEFNLAQFHDFGDLATAFHRVQDQALDSEVPPLVLFDEFDSQTSEGKLGWLKYFLAPMQDGEFRHREVTYKVGRAIFVFAGGTCHSFSDFYSANHGEKEEMRAAKLPDFVSRLRGHLNISGVNPSSDGITPILMMRRAILLHAFLKRHCRGVFHKGIADIDKGVIRAFLQTVKYEHGARSMEAIVQMANITARGTFQKASVPHHNQLQMHVDADEFTRLVHSL